jgi:holo-[acyl-carrier protein] synthase
VILGIGSDICDIRRIEKVIAGHGERFLERVFTELERAKAMRRTEAIRAATFAKRFAAKEAASKALGTGFRRGVFMSDLGVVNLPGGQPTLHMTGGAAARLAAITPAGMQAAVALTMTDEYPYAYAQVIISAIPLPA